jgi:SHS2 domain-containing protein
MKRYEFLEHTADVKFRAYGKNLEEAFGNAALAFTDVVIDVKEVKDVEEKLFEVESENKESLLYDFLEYCLNLMETKRFAIAKIKKIKIEKNKEYKLTAVVGGDTGLQKYKYKREVKAVTYNDMEIKEEKGKAEVQVVLDL